MPRIDTLLARNGRNQSEKNHQHCCYSDMVSHLVSFLKLFCNEIRLDLNVNLHVDWLRRLVTSVADEKAIGCCARALPDQTRRKINRRRFRLPPPLLARSLGIKADRLLHSEKLCIGAHTSKLS